MEEDNKKIVQEKLAQSVKGKGSVKCPSCTSLIEWEDSEQYNPDGSKDRYFWCSNDACELHQKDVVKVSISTGFLQTFQQNFSKIGQGAIAAAFGALSVWGYGYLNPTEGNAEELKKLKTELLDKQKENKKDEAEMTKQLSELKAEIERLAKGGTTVTPVTNFARVDSLEKVISKKNIEIAEKNNEIVALAAKSGTSELSPQEMADLGVFYSTGKNKKSKTAIKYLFQALENPKASFTDKQYEKIVYSLVRLSPSLALDKFEPLLKKIKSPIPEDMVDVEKAKVYWHYADEADSSKERELKLASIEHYLEGASKYTISQQDINDAMQLIELYGLNDIATENFQSTMDIGTAFSNGDKQVIRAFLKYARKPESKLFFQQQ